MRLLGSAKLGAPDQIRQKTVQKSVFSQYLRNEKDLMDKNWQAYSTYQVLPYGRKSAPIRPQISEISIFKEKYFTAP